MFGGFGVKELLIILCIVIVIFGSKKLVSLGSDLGQAIKGFKKEVGDSDVEKDKNN